MIKVNGKEVTNPLARVLIVLAVIPLVIGIFLFIGFILSSVAAFLIVLLPIILLIVIAAGIASTRK